MSADLSSDTPCIVTVLDSGGAAGVDVGGAGLIESTNSSLVLAPAPCTTGGQDVDAGLTLQLQGGLLGQVNVPVDPSTLAVTDTASLGTLTVGGVALSNTRMDLSVDPTEWSIGITGDSTVAGATVALTGSFQGSSTIPVADDVSGPPITFGCAGGTSHRAGR